MKSSLSPLYQSPNIAAKDQEENHSGCDHDFRGKKIAIPVRSGIDAPKKIESKPPMDINESAEAFINKFKQAPKFHFVCFIWTIFCFSLFLTIFLYFLTIKV